MKKLFCAITMLAFMAMGMPTANAAKHTDKEKKELTVAQQARLNQIVQRVEEIKDMDKSQLSRADKKELKQELKEMKKEAKILNGGVYLSVGAIIIIILLLILIL